MKLDVNLDEVIVKIEDAEIIVRPLDLFTLQAIQDKYLEKGKIVDDAGFSAEVLENAIVGWKGIQDKNGKEIEFKKERIRPLITALSIKDQSFVERLVKAAQSLFEEVQKNKKKSKNGLNSK